MSAVTGIVAVLLVLFWAWYAVGLWRVLGHPQGRRRYRWRAAALALGVASALLVTVSPAAEALEQRLAGHMVQHLTLILVTAPLLAVSAPGPVLLAALPAGHRPGVASLLRRRPLVAVTSPHLAWVLQIAALWLWHLPGAYDAALDSPTVHLLEHAAFLGTAWLFWWQLARWGRHRLRGPAAFLYVALAVPPGAALGAVLTFAAHPLYPAQAARALAAGVDPLLDQRIAGLVMWVPLDLAYLALAIWLFGRWLTTLEARTPAGRTLPADALAGTEVTR